MKSGFDGGSPLYTLTVGEFFELLDSHLGDITNNGQSQLDTPSGSGRLVYGLRGIQELFGCSHRTAQYYKDYVIKEAVMQNGRKIVVDADLALKLFNERRGK